MLKTTNNLSREIDVLEKLKSSPHVITMLQYFYSKNASDQIIQNIVVELGEFDLEHYIYKIRKSDKLKLHEAKNMLLQVGRGIRDMHALNICHRDLKP